APKHKLEEYEEALARTMGKDAAHRFMQDTRALAKRMQKAGAPRIALVSATFSGGGVAEMFQTQAHILQHLGIELEWQKTWAPDGAYGEVCRKAFDAFQGGATVIPDLDHKLWRNHNELLADIYRGLAMDKKVSAIFLEDHHAIHMIPAIKAANPDKRIVWRSHVDMAGVLAGKPGALDVWQKAILPMLERLDENDVILFQPGSVPPEAHKLRANVFVAPPGIDPLSKKNEPITWEEARATLLELSRELAPNAPADKPYIDPNRPHIVTGGRFVPWKGIIPTVRAFIAIAKEHPDIDLLVFGSAGKDDWRKVEYLQQFNLMMAEAGPEIASRIKVVLNKSEELAAGYKLAAHHKLPAFFFSLAEGYNLMQDEALVHDAAVGNSRVGGLERNSAGPLAWFSTQLGKYVKALIDPKLLYGDKDGTIDVSPEAKAIEDDLAATFRRVLDERANNREAYDARYDEAVGVGKGIAIRNSLPRMSDCYMALASATPLQLAIAAQGERGTAGAAHMGTVAEVMRAGSLIR
ncbi:MAG TPA: hypothetical protein VLC93_03075, partial [Myxococcota bacterium]|nr:hypothetical protein [Myxococcota bacterium]